MTYPTICNLLVLFLGFSPQRVFITDAGPKVRNIKMDSTFGSHLDTARAAFKKELSDGYFDPQATDLLDAARAATQTIFKLPTLHAPRAVTKRDHGDRLVVEWQIDEPYARGFVMLDDN